MEKILKHTKVDDEVIPGKLTIADLNMLNFWILFSSPKMDAMDVLEENAPTVMKVVNKLRADSKLGPIISKLQETPYLPF